MTCKVCGTEVPRGAMFCAECGSAIGPRTMNQEPLRPEWVPPEPARTEPASPEPARPGSTSSKPASAEPASSGKLNLGKLGFGKAHRDRSDQDAARQEALFGPRETVVIEPDDMQLIPEPVEDSWKEPEPESWQSPELRPWMGDGPEPRPTPEPGLDYSASVRPRFAPMLKPEPRPEAPQTQAGAGDSSDHEERPDPFPWGNRGPAIFTDSDELEKTIIVPRRAAGERFTLQFSTGESVTVFGSGLLGRNPTPQPGEFFDQLVGISDPGKSVSKTHLEFGQESGSFWVSDRYSGNGSVVREPEAEERRLVAGRRYRIVRGTRVDIGEQFFVVS